MTPIVKLLRLCDGVKPAMGKIYDRMFMLVDKAKKSTASWAPQAVKAIEARWEYLHRVRPGLLRA